MSNNIKDINPCMVLTEEQYEESGRLDVNIKLHIKVKPHDNHICAYGTHRRIICMAESPSDFEYVLEEFIKTKLQEADLYVDKMVIV